MMILELAPLVIVKRQKHFFVHRVNGKFFSLFHFQNHDHLREFDNFVSIGGLVKKLTFSF